MLVEVQLGPERNVGPRAADTGFLDPIDFTIVAVLEKRVGFQLPRRRFVTWPAAWQSTSRKPPRVLLRSPPAFAIYKAAGYICFGEVC